MYRLELCKDKNNKLFFRNIISRFYLRYMQSVIRLTHRLTFKDRSKVYYVEAK